jgi:hypothetical protein
MRQERSIERGEAVRHMMLSGAIKGMNSTVVIHKTEVKERKSCGSKNEGAVVRLFLHTAFRKLSSASSAAAVSASSFNA